MNYNCSSKMHKYDKGIFLGQGTFGVVHKATPKGSDRELAIKKIRMGNITEDGVPFVGLREIKLLRELGHPNVIQLVDVFTHNGAICLVFEFAQTDLEAIIKSPEIVLSPADIKCYMEQLLRAVEYCHKNWVLHRDLKPNNLLITPDGTLKLTDFGLARVFGSPNRRFTHQVVTRWYRAPELLFGCQQYGPGVDMWAVGCIFAELMLRRPLLAGDSDIDQLSKIFAALGTPTEEQWPGMTQLPDYVKFEPTPAPPLRSLFSAAGEDAMDLLFKMLKFDPVQRISATDALAHPYFTNGPAPTEPKNLRLPPKKVE